MTPPATTATAPQNNITARAAAMPPPSNAQGGSVRSRKAGGWELYTELNRSWPERIVCMEIQYTPSSQSNSPLPSMGR